PGPRRPGPAARGGGPAPAARRERRDPGARSFESAYGRFWVNSGYAPVNGLRMYYEAHGQGGPGRPLVLLHGGLLTIELSFGAVLGQLAAGRQVIATELQGHGRTADIEREL